MVTVPSIKVTVEHGGTYDFIKGKQNNNQCKVRSFNRLFWELLSIIILLINHCVFNFFVFSYFNEFIATFCKCIKTIFQSSCFIICWVYFVELLFFSTVFQVPLFLLLISVSILIIACWFWSLISKVIVFLF